jgi:outer membrane protein TolC
MQELYLGIVVIVFSFLASLNAHGDEILGVDQFLDQVKRANSGYQGAASATEGALQQSVEGKLVTTPAVFANVTLSGDSKLSDQPIGSYDRAVQNDYQFGVSDTTSFGMTAKLYYDATYYNFTNINYGTFAPPFSYSLFDARPILNITQPIWGNGFGRSTRAQADFTESSALSVSYSSRFQSKTILANAEAVYWNLSIARQLVNLQLDAEERAQKIYDYNSRRAKLHLSDEADMLQSAASLETRKLDVQAARDNERTAARSFNTARNVSSDNVSENLVQATHPIAESLRVPVRAEIRDDVKAAQENSKAQQANAVIHSEADLPTLQVFGSFALNGRSDDFAPSVTNAFSAGRNTITGGVQFSMPLAIGTTSTARDGWAKQKAGAELTYDKSLFDSEQNWQDLNLRFTEAKRRLSMARSIEEAERKKLVYEKDRLTKGRTTTFQVLLFEQDYELAQVTRVNAEGDVFSIYTQMKLFE